MTRRSKNHHFIPQVLQRQFLAGEKQIWYAERGPDGAFGAPQLRNIEKVFRKKNFYTIIDGDDRSDAVERDYYGNIDNYLGEIFPSIKEKLDQGIIPTFSGEPLRSIRQVVLAMTKRTPEFVKKYDEVKIGREVVTATLAAMDEDADDGERRDLQKALEDENRMREFGRSVRVQAIVDRSDLVEEALESFSVRWAVSETKHSYILSSMVAYRIGNGGSNGLSNPNMEMWMPVNPKVALVMLRDPERKIPQKVVDTPEQIRKVNQYAMQNSTQIVSHSMRLLESLTGRKAVDRSTKR